MSDPIETFGHSIVEATSGRELLGLEEQAGRSDRFILLDTLIANLVHRSLNGQRLVSLERGRGDDHVTILGLDPAQRRFVDDWFLLEHQQAKGDWFLPDKATLKIGLVNLPFWFRTQPRYATGIAAEERGRVQFQGSSDGLLLWALLEPVFTQLFAPFELRGPQAGLKDRESQKRSWTDVDVFMEELDVDVSKVLAIMRYGGGWSKLRAAQQLEAKQRLIQALATQVGRSHLTYYRALRIRSLATRYYQKAGKHRPTHRQVLTRDLQRVLSGYFGGDWLAFLDYIGEEPNPADRIATALPETHLFTGDRDRIRDVAKAEGLQTEQVEQVLSVFWGGDAAVSPLDQRTEVLREFWGEFDHIHARQESGMRPLWGLIDDRGVSLFSSESAQPYQSGLYQALLSEPLLAQIDQLWGTVMLPRWPEHIVSALSPHVMMAETLGPALKFWHGCALTAWFICEGPSSRTDLAGLTNYYQSELSMLEQLGFPVDPALFHELRRAEARLGPVQQITDAEHTSEEEISPGIRLTIQMNIGTRRAGFAMLRSIITRHRRMWADQFLESYLHLRWDSEIRDAARNYHLLFERKGKAPTPKQFGRHAVVATNHWFAGDISGLYRTIGERVPLQPERIRLVPPDREAFAWAVFANLGGHKIQKHNSSDNGGNDHWRSNLIRLAEQSLTYLQLEEALGHPPRLNEFGRGKFEWVAPSLAPAIDDAWSIYQRAIQAAAGSFTTDVVKGSSPAKSAVSQVSDTVSMTEHVSASESRRSQGSFWKRLLRRS